MEKETPPSDPINPTESLPASPPSAESPEKSSDKPKEIGGPRGLEPTRYGDWERNGRCIDF